MKLEDQVVSLELAKKLKELGVKQDGHYVWMTLDTMVYPPNRKPEEGWAWSLMTESHYDYIKIGGETTCSAFTVSELGEMLPIGYHVQRMSQMDWIAYIGAERKTIIDDVQTEADARALFLMGLIEKGIVRP